MKTKKAYIALKPLAINSPIPINYPKGMIYIIGVFTSKKEAEKYSDELLEVELQANKQ